MNNNYNNQLSFLDILNIMSFYIDLMNLEQNMTQNDMQELQHDLTQQTQQVLDEIHAHLGKQDAKLDLIMEKLGLEVVDNDD